MDLNMTNPAVDKHITQPTNIAEMSTCNNCDDNNNSGKKNQNSQISIPSDNILSNYSQKTDIVFISVNDDSDTADDGKYNFKKNFTFS